MKLEALDIDDLLAQALQADPALRAIADDASARPLLAAVFASVRASVDALSEQPVSVEGLGLFRRRIQGRNGKKNARRWVLFETHADAGESPRWAATSAAALPPAEQFPALQFIFPPMRDETQPAQAPPDAADPMPAAGLEVASEPAPGADPAPPPAALEWPAGPGEPAPAAQIVWPHIPDDAPPAAEPPSPAPPEPVLAGQGSFEPPQPPSLQLPPQPLPPQPLPPEPPQPVLAWASAYLAAERPLLDPGHQLMLVYSRLSASTPAVLWFLLRMGLLPPPHARREKPHARLETGLFLRPDVAAALQTPPHAWTLVRVVRDPLERAVSGFRQALATGYARAAMLDKLGIDIDRSGLSFQQYIDFLESEDLDLCHAMHRRQMHPVERLRTPDFLINVSRQDLAEQLGEVERTLGLAPTDWAALRRHEAPRAKLRGRMAPSLTKPDEVRLTRHQALHGPWPSQLLTPRAVTWLKDLYAEDVAAYGAPARGADEARTVPTDAARAAAAG